MTWTRRIEEQRQWPVERSDYQGDAIRLSIDFGGVSAFPKEPWETTTSMGFIHPFNSAFAKAAGPHGSHDLEDFSWLAVLKSLLIAASRPSEFSLHNSQDVSAGRYALVRFGRSENRSTAFCLLKISWNEFIQVSLWDVRFVLRFDRRPLNLFRS